MKTSPKLGSTIYIEVAGDQAAPVFLAESPLPLDWGHSFSNARITHNALDIHLLSGSSYRASENHTLGRWRVSEIAAGGEEKFDVQVKVRVNTDGMLEVSAALGDQPLNVFRLPGGSAKVPLVLDEAGLGRVDNPGDEKAVDRGDVQSDESQVLASQTSVDAPGADIRCEQCGGTMEIRIVGEMRGKQMVCTYCGSEADLPEAFLQAIQSSEHEDSLADSDSPDSLGGETRDDKLPGLKPFGKNPKVEELSELIKQGGLEGVDKETIEVLKKHGFDIPREGQSSIVSAIRRLDKLNEDMKNKKPRGYIPLTPREILELAGEPLSPEERRNCPKCEAVIARDARQCPWCSVSLTGSQDG